MEGSTRGRTTSAAARDHHSTVEAETMTVHVVTTTTDLAAKIIGSGNNKMELT